MSETNNKQSKQESGDVAPQQVSKNVEEIMRLEEKQIHRRSPVENVADKITTLAGSTPCLLIHLTWFASWIVVNVGLVPGVEPFDPFPFSFLTLVVSLEAIFLTLLVLMSQNRMTKEADKRAHLDLQVNLLAEQESTLTLRMVQRIGKHIGLDPEEDEEVERLKERTDVQQLAATLDEKSRK
jgi:uncharacterized membrane protein